MQQNKKSKKRLDLLTKEKFKKINRQITVNVKESQKLSSTFRGKTLTKTNAIGLNSVSNQNINLSSKLNLVNTTDLRINNCESIEKLRKQSSINEDKSKIQNKEIRSNKKIDQILKLDTSRLLGNHYKLLSSSLIPALNLSSSAHCTQRTTNSTVCIDLPALPKCNESRIHQNRKLTRIVKRLLKNQRSKRKLKRCPLSAERVLIDAYRIDEPIWTMR